MGLGKERGEEMTCNHFVFSEVTHLQPEPTSNIGFITISLLKLELREGLNLLTGHLQADLERFLGQVTLFA